MFAIAVCNYTSNICISNKVSVGKTLFLQGVETVEVQRYHQPVMHLKTQWTLLQIL